jgi:hypothetical protein
VAWLVDVVVVVVAELGVHAVAPGARQDLVRLLQLLLLVASPCCWSPEEFLAADESSVSATSCCRGEPVES